MKIALLGSIPKGDDLRKDWTDWKKEYKQVMGEVLSDVEFVNGDAISDSAGPELVVGHDLSMVKQSDLCVVDARTKIGAGTAQEIVIAKYFKKPVVTVIPQNTHHRRSNVVFHGATVEDWIHPFLFVSSDYVAEWPIDAANWIVQNVKRVAVKDLSIFDEAIKQYEESTHARSHQSDQE